MEALAAFGIACNVIQVISFTRETIAICKEIYSSGTLLDHDGHVNKAVSQYESLCGELHMKIKDESAVFDPDKAELLEIARDCLSASIKLKDATSKLVSPAVKGNAFRSLYSGVSSRWKEGRLHKLEAAVNKHQARLDSLLLMKICKATDAVAIQQNDKFAALDETLRLFVGNIAQGQKSIRSAMVSQEVSITTHTTKEIAAQTIAIKEQIANDTLLTRELIALEISKNHTVAKNSQFSIAKQSFRKLLHSLNVEGLQERRSQIIAPHDGTFEWVFDSEKWKIERLQSGLEGAQFNNTIDNNECTRTDRANSEHTCGPASTATFDCFPCWLAEKPGSPYWLCGKAGSGKSTLVKFFVDHEKTRRLLERAHGHVLILSHFFWLSGSLVQRSLQGMALSLLNQLICQLQAKEDHDGPIPEVPERSWTWTAARIVLKAVPSASHKTSAQDWSYEELCGAVVALLDAYSSTVCIFLDGLDEADAESQSASPKPVLDLVDKLCRIPCVKVCVSSRPEPAFQTKFRGKAHLLLQQLTRDDIVMYVVNKFESQSPPDWEVQDGGSSAMRDLATKVCEYSDGVFLWVRLVTRSLLHGMVNGDTISQMHERLALLPRNINKLYQNMWNRLEEEDREIYHRKAALYIKMALDAFQLRSSLFLHDASTTHILCDIQLFAANNPLEIGEIFDNPRDNSVQAVHSKCVQFGKRVEALTAGLLEVVQTAPESDETGQVGFIHRSAREFFLNTVEGKRILTIDDSTRVWRLGAVLRGILFRKWLDWYKKVSPLSARDGMKLDIFHSFLTALIQAFHIGLLDREQQMSLIYLCERAYVASSGLADRRTRAIEWRYNTDDISRPLIETFDFGYFIIRLGNKIVLATCLGADLKDTSHLVRGAGIDPWSSRLPMVYSQSYRAFILFNLLRLHLGEEACQSLQENYECILWMLDQGIVENWPQGRNAAGTTLGFAGASALSLLRSLERNFELQYLTVLQRCLSLKDAWEETPIFSVEEILPRTGVCPIPQHPIAGNLFLFSPKVNSYLLLCQATMPFVVLAGLESIHTEDKAALRLVQELKTEVWRRYPDGPPPAKIFMLQWHDNVEGFVKGNQGFLDVSDMPWSSLSFSQFQGLLRPGTVGVLEGHVLAVDIDECKKWMSEEELEEEIRRRMGV